MYSSKTHFMQSSFRTDFFFLDIAVEELCSLFFSLKPKLIYFSGLCRQRQYRKQIRNTKLLGVFVLFDFLRSMKMLFEYQFCNIYPISDWFQICSSSFFHAKAAGLSLLWKCIHIHSEKRVRSDGSDVPTKSG